MSSFNLDTNSGLYSKLMGMFNVPPGQFVAQAVRVKVEDLLRPFIVANKSKFLDFPQHAFSSIRLDDRQREHLKSIAPPAQKNWSVRFNGTYQP